MKGSKAEAFWRQLGLLAVLAVLGFSLAVGSGACGPPPGGEKVGDEGTPDSGSPDKQTQQDDPVKPDVPTTQDEPPKDVPINPPEDTPKDDPVPPPDQPTPTKGSGEATGAKAAASAQNAPLDASPSPDGKTIYYTAFKKAADDMSKPNEIGQNEGALFKVSADGKGTPTELAAGFLNPTGLVVSKDGKTIYVADAGVGKTADDGKDDTKTGAIYSVPETGGSKTKIAQTEGYHPRSMDLVSDPADQIYFSGIDPADGKAGVFRMPAAGGAINVVSKDAKFKDLGGVAVAKDGTAYVAETIGGSGGNISSVFKISGGNVTELTKDIRVGYPAGLALSEDESHLLVSGVKPDEGTSVVYRIKVADGSIVARFDKDIGTNSNSGGLHRAHNQDVFAWADISGTVYLVGTLKSPLP